MDSKNLQPNLQQTCNLASNDTISRKAAIDAICTEGTRLERNGTVAMAEIKQWCVDILEELPSTQPERLTDDDFETIRIHLNAYKEKLCNQRRWEEAEEYQRIIDRFMSFASAQPEDCDTCKHGYFGDGKCDNCRVRFPSHYERRTDESD